MPALDQPENPPPEDEYHWVLCAWPLARYVAKYKHSITLVAYLRRTGVTKHVPGTLDDGSTAAPGERVDAPECSSEKADLTALR